MRGRTLIGVLLLLTVVAPVSAQDQSQDSSGSRAGLLAAERDKKATETSPPQRGRVERALYRYDQENGALPFISQEWHGLQLASVDPILKSGAPVYEYEPGTWGPREVDARLLPPGGWHNPTVAAARTETVMTLAS
jgi:hypothetical protein